MATLHVDLVAPDRSVWSGEASMVVARTSEGDIGILPGHTPLLGAVLPGAVRIERSGEKPLVAAVLGGFLSVTEAGVTILAEAVELADEIDTGRAREALARAQQAGPDDEEAALAAARASARLRAAGDIA